MSNLQPRQFQQLPLLMTPDELGNLKSADFVGHQVRDVPHLYTKLPNARAHEEKLAGYDNMAQNLGGQRRPVVVAHSSEGSELWDGHHRATVAMARGDLMPVTHFEVPDDPDEAIGMMRQVTRHERDWDSSMDEITGGGRGR